jgi:hypothetical protein
MSLEDNAIAKIPYDISGRWDLSLVLKQVFSLEEWFADCRSICSAVPLMVAFLLAVLAGCGGNSRAPFDLSQAKYVGHQNCVSCHQEQAQQHIGSHHDQAMQLANDESVLANFNNVEFEHHGIVSRFYRDGKRFMVNTEGPDGRLHDYEIK